MPSQQQAHSCTDKRGCSVCENVTRTQLVCPGCINNTLLYERRKVLLELHDKREALLLQLNALLAKRVRQHACAQPLNPSINAHKADAHPSLKYALAGGPWDVMQGAVSKCTKHGKCFGAVANGQH